MTADIATCRTAEFEKMTHEVLGRLVAHSNERGASPLGADCADAHAVIMRLVSELSNSRNDEREAVRACHALGNSVQEWEAKFDRERADGARLRAAEEAIDMLGDEAA